MRPTGGHIRHTRRTPTSCSPDTRSSGPAPPDRIPLQLKGIKTLIAQIQHPAQFLLLFLGVIRPQAPADPAGMIPRVVADGTDRLFLPDNPPAGPSAPAACAFPHWRRRFSSRSRSTAGTGSVPCRRAWAMTGSWSSAVLLQSPAGGAAGQTPLPPPFLLLAARTAVLVKPLQSQAHHPSVIAMVRHLPVAAQLLHILPHLVAAGSSRRFLRLRGG